MKGSYYLFIFFGFAAWSGLFLFSCNGNKTWTGTGNRLDTLAYTDTMPHIVFTKQAIDLGKIAEGESVEVDFDYYNSGNNNLLISHVETSCGCTIVKWKNAPLPRGDHAILKVIFNSKGFSGIQNKSIRITTNSRKPFEILALTANVIPEEN